MGCDRQKVDLMVWEEKVLYLLRQDVSRQVVMKFYILSCHCVDFQPADCSDKSERRAPEGNAKIGHMSYRSVGENSMVDLRHLVYATFDRNVRTPQRGGSVSHIR